MLLSLSSHTRAKRDLIFWGSFFLLKLMVFGALCPYWEVDTSSYLVSPFSVSKARTPVYPLLLFLGQKLPDAVFGEFVCCVQFLVSCVSCVLLYQAFRMIGAGSGTAKVLIVLYGFNIAVVPWDGILLTESLALSLTAVYVWFCARLTTNTAPVHLLPESLGLAALTLVMLFLRPTFMVLIPISCYLCYYRAVKSKVLNLKRALAIALIFLLVLACVLGYSGIHAQKYGSFTLSSILSNQQYCHVIELGLYKNIPANEITRFIESRGPDQDPLLTGYLISDTFPAEQASETLTRIIRSDPVSYLTSRFQAYLESVSLPFGRRPHFRSGLAALPGMALSGISFLLLPPIPFGVCLPLAFAALVLCLTVWIKKHRFDVILFGCGGYILLTLASTMLGTTGDYARTALSCFPFLFILVLHMGILLRNGKQPFAAAHESGSQAAEAAEQDTATLI